MNITFDKQDITDAICVYVATQINGGHVEGSHPELVSDIHMVHTKQHGFSANATIYGRLKMLSQQDLIEAIGLYLSAYYSFQADRLLINLSYDDITHEFGANIVIER